MKVNKIYKTNKAAILILLLSFLSFLGSSVASQNTVKFAINSDRTKYTIPNSPKDYYVLNYENQSQESLFNKVLNGIYKTNAMSQDYWLRSIDLKAVGNSFISVPGQFLTQTPDQHSIHLTLEFEFLPGKIKVMPVLDNDPDHQKYNLSDFLVVNTIINDILSEVNSTEDW